MLRVKEDDVAPVFADERCLVIAIKTNVVAAAFVALHALGPWLMKQGSAFSVGGAKNVLC